MKIVNTALTRAIAAILIGTLMIVYSLMPEVFMSYLVYIIAILIVIAAIGEFVALGVIVNDIKNYKTQLTDVEFEEGTQPVVPHIGYFYCILPTLLLLFGLFILIRPATVESAPFKVFGIVLLCYALSEIINGIKFYAVRRTIQNELDSLVDEEETPDATNATNATNATKPAEAPAAPEATTPVSEPAATATEEDYESVNPTE